MIERPLIAIDLDNTFADYTTAFKECLSQMGYDDYADAPDPSDYSFACEGWFDNVRTQPVLHRRAVGLGLYLRERPYPHAPEALDDLHYGGFRIVLATSRYDDQEDTDRWLCGMGFEGGRLDDLGECRNGGQKLPESRLEDGDWKCVAYTDSQRTELTVHIKGDKVGLYKADGKALAANGKNE